MGICESLERERSLLSPWQGGPQGGRMIGRYQSEPGGQATGEHNSEPRALAREECHGHDGHLPDTAQAKACGSGWSES